MKMTLSIFIIVLLGILTGYFYLPDEFLQNMDILINVVLTVTIFFIGIGIGENNHIFKDLKKAGKNILILPIGTIIGSFLGGALAGLILHRSITLSLAIASGFGWYSISAGLLLPVAGVEASTVGFIANVIREMLAFLLIPIIAKKLSPYTAISIGGATTMDTTLPLVSKSSGEEYAVISFIHGGLISLLVPILVELFAGI